MMKTNVIADAPRCIIYSTTLFDLGRMGRHLKLKMPNTPPLPHGHRTVKKQELLVDHESPKEAI